MNTIDAMKQCLLAAEAFTDQEGNMPTNTGEFNDLKACITVLINAIAREEAQTVEWTRTEALQLLQIGNDDAFGANDIDEMISLLAAIEVARQNKLFTRPALPPSGEREAFNAAINFAIDQGSDAGDFLNAWLHGDTHEWPEFIVAAAPHSPQAERVPNPTTKSE